MGFPAENASPQLARESSLSAAGIPIFCGFRAVISDLYLFLADGAECLLAAELDGGVKDMLE
eukprot:6466318-Lingulodinium_polyedra.AAC.1